MIKIYPIPSMATRGQCLHFICDKTFLLKNTHYALIIFNCPILLQIIEKNNCYLNLPCTFLSFVFPVDVLIEDNPALCQILHLLEEGGPRPLAFVLNANLLVNVKLVTCESDI